MNKIDKIYFKKPIKFKLKNKAVLYRKSENDPMNKIQR
jgi:hypothetical protein